MGSPQSPFFLSSAMMLRRTVSPACTAPCVLYKARGRAFLCSRRAALVRSPRHRTPLGLRSTPCSHPHLVGRHQTCSSRGAAENAAGRAARVPLPRTEGAPRRRLHPPATGSLDRRPYPGHILPQGGPGDRTWYHRYEPRRLEDYGVFGTPARHFPTPPNFGLARTVRQNPSNPSRQPRPDTNYARKQLANIPERQQAFTAVTTDTSGWRRAHDI
jgi:hypothetical protein